MPKSRNRKLDRNHYRRQRLFRLNLHKKREDNKAITPVISPEFAKILEEATVNPFKETEIRNKT